MGRPTEKERVSKTKAVSSIEFKVKDENINSAKRGVMYQHLYDTTIILCSEPSMHEFELKGSIVHAGGVSDQLGRVVVRNLKEFKLFKGIIKLEQ